MTDIRHRHIQYFVTSALVLALNACGGGSKETPPNVNPTTPSVNISLNKTTLYTGQTATLSWSSSNANSCVASGAWSGSQTTSGSLNITALNIGANTYTLSCSSASGSSTQSVILTVNRPSMGLIAGQVGSTGHFDGAGSDARFDNPSAIVFDSVGNTFVADRGNQVIRKVSVAGVVTTYAGVAGKRGYADGPATAALFNDPNGLAIDSHGNLFVSDSGNSVIRKIDANGIVSTIAGEVNQTGTVDGIGSAARFWGSSKMSIDKQGNLYIIDNYGREVRKISTANEVSTLTPFGQLLALPPEHPCPIMVRGCPRYSHATDLFIDDNNTIFVGDFDNAQIIYLNKNGVRGVLAISGAKLSAPSAIQGDTLGTVFVSDLIQRKIYKLHITGPIDSLSASATLWKDFGGGGIITTNDGFPHTIAAYQDKFLIFADQSSLQKVNANGDISNFVGKREVVGSNDGIGDAAKFNNPNTLVADNKGNLFISDTDNHLIRKLVVATGEVTTFVGRAGVAGGDDGMGTLATLTSPKAMAIDASGNLYLAETLTHTIRKISPSGMVSTFAGKRDESGTVDGHRDIARLKYPTALAFDKNGNLIVSEYGAMRKIAPNGDIQTIALTSADPNKFPHPASAVGSADRLEIDSQGNIFVLDTPYNRVFKISATGVVSLFAGPESTSNTPDYQDGKGSSARFNHPQGLSIDQYDNLLIADTGNNTIRKITADGTVTTIADTLGKLTVNLYSNSVLSRPRGITIDKSGKVFLILDQAVFQISL